MSRSTDLIIIRGEVANLTEEQFDRTLGFAAANIWGYIPSSAFQTECLAESIKAHRELAYEKRMTEDDIRYGRCDCITCEFGRVLDDMGLL